MIGAILTSVIVAFAVLGLIAYCLAVYVLLAVLLGLVMPPAR